MRDERNDRELDGRRRRDQAGEQPEDDQHCADRLEKKDRIGGEDRGLDPAARHAARGERIDGGGKALLRHRHHFHDAVHQQHSTRREAHDQPREVTGM